MTTEVKVGVFVALALALLAYMTVRLGDFKFGEPEGYQVWAVFDQATGLKAGAPVEMAGIQIGSVKAIGLYQGRAKVSMVIRDDVGLAANSTALIRTRGILGDKYVALEQGSEAAPRLKNGDKLAQAEVPTDIDQVMVKIGRIADDVKELTGALKVSLGSPESQENIKESLTNLRDLTGALKTLVLDNQQRLDTVVANLNSFTGDLKEVTGANKEALTETIQNFRQVSSQLNVTIAALGSVAEKIDQGKGTIGALVNERQTLDELNSTLASLKEVTKKIESGEGTIGKLINDDTVVTKIDDALTGINDYITKADAWRVYVDYRGEYLFGEDALRSTLNLRLQPTADKFYIIGIQDDPVGRRTEKTTTTTVEQGGVSWDRKETVVTVDKDELKFNAQIGKRFHDLAFRAGLFASSGGFGADYYLLNDNLKLTLEAYDFRTDTNPHLRFAADYMFWRYFYLSAGVDDFISDDDHGTFFLGGGVAFDDQDLKWLLTSMPTP